MTSPFDRAIQYCESLFRGLPQDAAHPDDAESVRSTSSWESLQSFKEALRAPLMPRTNKEPKCHHMEDGRCVSNISSGKKVLMFDEKTFQFKLTDPL